MLPSCSSYTIHPDNPGGGWANPLLHARAIMAMRFTGLLSLEKTAVILMGTTTWPWVFLTSAWAVCLGSWVALTGTLALWFARDGNVWIRSQETALSCLLVPRCLHPCLLSLKGSRKLLDIDYAAIAALYRIPIFLSFFTEHVYRKTVIILGGCLIY
jgi:hypothetical protein